MITNDRKIRKNPKTKYLNDLALFIITDTELTVVFACMTRGNVLMRTRDSLLWFPELHYAAPPLGYILEVGSTRRRLGSGTLWPPNTTHLTTHKPHISAITDN